MSDWGTPTPDLTLVKNACRVMENDGLDVHTITILLDNGYWKVQVLATKEDMENISRTFELDSTGSGIKEVAPR